MSSVVGEIDEKRKPAAPITFALTSIPQLAFARRSMEHREVRTLIACLIGRHSAKPT